LRTDCGFVHQEPARRLRWNVSAGGDIGERLMALDDRRYGNIRAAALRWLDRFEIAANRVDDAPATYSGGMRQRLRIARNRITRPRSSSSTSPWAASAFPFRRACSICCAV
jgi:putative phosphonate transport system ATP-binding protein